MDDDVRSVDASAPVDLADEDGIREVPPSDPEAEAEAEAFERRVQAEANEQFKRLKDAAQDIYGLTRGRPGVRTPEEWTALLEKAGDEIGNGHFLVRCLGAERYFEPAIVAVLITLRQNLMSECSHATAADVMMIDAAVIGYFNMLRTQRWIGDLCIVVERELFGQEPLNEIHGDKVGDRLEEQLRRLAEVLLPLQDRAGRMMMRSLEPLRYRFGFPAKARPRAQRKKRLATAT